jgi:hypothetical protein
MLSFDPSKRGGYPNGRLLTNPIIAHRLAILSNGKSPADGLKPHTDLLASFPCLGTLSAGSMLCDGAWPADRVALIRRWVDEGCAP